MTRGATDSGVLVERDVPVVMRDGTRLLTDVYRPADAGAHPALVQRTPYDKDNMLYTFAATVDPVRAAERGYAVVVQDCRGRSKSQGEWHPFRYEADDGHDTVEWVAGQPWCNGKVGTYGNSYMATTALQAAIGAPPHLVAVFSYMGGPAYHRGWAYSHGVLELGFGYFWVLRGAWETLRRADLPPERHAELAATLRIAISRTHRVISDLPVSDLPGVAPDLVPFWRDWLEHPSYDEYWRAFDVVEHADRIQVPVLHVSGLYDNFLDGHLALNDRLTTHHSSDVKNGSRFVLGPWDHEAYLGARPSAAGIVDFTPDAPNGYRLCHDLALDWFDARLTDARPEAPAGGVSYFDTGEAKWHHAGAWPPPAQNLALLLASDGQANSSAGDGRLVASMPEGADADRFVYDPLDPVPTVGGRNLFPSLSTAGVQDQRAVEQRNDVLVYTGEALADRLRVVGRVVVTLHASTDGEDTDFTAKLIDVEPDGFCRNIAEGIVRARYRGGAEAPVFVEPGAVMELAVDLLAVAHTFARGHRVRLEISSSNFPRFDRNLNGRVEPAFGRAEDARPAQQCVYHDAARRSRVDLPIVSS
jgi:uncharacterized protein